VYEAGWSYAASRLAVHQMDFTDRNKLATAQKEAKGIFQAVHYRYSTL
jgi:hypothetical protein